MIESLGAWLEFCCWSGLSEWAASFFFWDRLASRMLLFLPGMRARCDLPVGHVKNDSASWPSS